MIIFAQDKKSIDIFFLQLFVQNPFSQVFLKQKKRALFIEAVLGPKAQSTLNSIRLKSDVFLELGYLDEALRLQEDVLAVEISDAEVEGIADCYKGISKIYQQKMDFKTAEEYILKAISIYDTLPKYNRINRAYTFHQLGSISHIF